jgi:hypothetical protein
LLQVVQLTVPAELKVYADLIQILGSGEAACLSLAECRQWLIASDEKKKFRRETLARLGTGRLLNTPGILTLAITSGILTVEDADSAKAVLEQTSLHYEFPFLPRRSSSVVSTCETNLGCIPPEDSFTQFRTPPGSVMLEPRASIINVHKSYGTPRQQRLSTSALLGGQKGRLGETHSLPRIAAWPP